MREGRLPIEAHLTEEGTLSAAAPAPNARPAKVHDSRQQLSAKKCGLTRGEQTAYPLSELFRRRARVERLLVRRLAHGARLDSSLSTMQKKETRRIRPEQMAGMKQRNTNRIEEGACAAGPLGRGQLLLLAPLVDLLLGTHAILMNKHRRQTSGQFRKRSF